MRRVPTELRHLHFQLDRDNQWSCHLSESGGKPKKDAPVTDWKEYAAYYLKRLRGPEGGDAYHSLIEADDAVVPILIDAFRVEPDPAIRSELVDVVWQHRLPETTSFLSEALNDPVPEVWKRALDGLVALGGQSAIEVLESAKHRLRPAIQEERTRAEWIEEALYQIRQQRA